MGVDSGLGFRLQDVVERLETVGNVAHQQGAARVRHVDAMGAVFFHELRLFGELLRRVHMRHHQEARDIHAEIAGIFDMLLGDVGFRTVGRNAHRPGAGFICLAQVFDGADTGQEEGGEFCVFQHAGRRFDIVEVGLLGETVIERHPGEPVAVGNLDRIDLRIVQRLADGLDVIEAVLVADGVHPVAQGDVLNVNLLFFIDCHVAVLRPSPCGARSRVPPCAGQRTS